MKKEEAKSGNKSSTSDFDSKQKRNIKEMKGQIIMFDNSDFVKEQGKHIKCYHRWRPGKR